MTLHRNILQNKRTYQIALVVLALSLGIFATLGFGNVDDFNTARREVLLRRIGHEILLQAGDSTSRVLPVRKIADNEYQISFENELSFQPDSLVRTTQRLLANDVFGSAYVVNVLNCSNSSVAYGYAIANNKKDDIVACLGREQPMGCYMIHIKFEPKGINTSSTKYILASLSLLAFAGFVALGSRKNKKAPITASSNKTYVVGSLQFDPQNKQLIANDKNIELTGTETRLLLIFASSPNETIERSRLQKEIWEDAGVIVGRSLDMFISKLRKKLAIDPSINIVVIRGKGYMLEVKAT